jgi:hypothetical protein
VRNLYQILCGKGIYYQKEFLEMVEVVDQEKERI